MSDLARSVLDADDPFAGGDVVPMRLGDAVIQRITQAIHEGRLKPGDSLPSESRIAASFVTMLTDHVRGAVSMSRRVTKPYGT